MNPSLVARSILIRGARQLLTLHGPPPPRRGRDMRDLGLINDGSVLIRDGRIYEANTSRRVEALLESRGAEEINAAGRVVLPGFVDSHAHLIAQPHVSQRALETQTLRLLEDLVRHGTTMIEARSGFGKGQREELKILRTHEAIRRQISMLASTFTAMLSPANGSNPNDYIDSVCSHLLPLIKRRKLAEFADIFCEDSSFSMDHVRRYVTTAKHFGLTPKIQGGRDIDEVIRLGVASVALAAPIGEEDIRSLVASEAVATLLPGTVFFTGKDAYRSGRNLIDAGAAVALATNFNPHTSPSYSMQTMIALACAKMGMTEAEAISAANINAACSLSRAHQIGSLEHGKAANVIILGVSDYREIPLHFGVNMVETTICRGEITYHRSEVHWPTTQANPADVTPIPTMNKRNNNKGDTRAVNL